MPLFVRPAFSLLRTTLMRRSMTSGKAPEQISKGGKEMSVGHQIMALACITAGIMGPGITLMLTREKPASDR